jgi:hypothetical protein
MTGDPNYRKDLHQRLRRAGIVSPVFTFKRGILRTSLIRGPRGESTMQDETRSEEGVRELPPPDGIEAEGAWEIIRAWIIDGELGVSMRAEVVPQPAQWGGILADLARWVTVIFKNETDEQGLRKILDEVVDGFTQRLAHPEPTYIDPAEKDPGGC